MTSRALALGLWVALGLAIASPAAAQTTAQSRADSLLATRVSSAIAAAADLRADSLQVSVRNGQVRITGSVVCDDCGGTRTPGGTGTVQQSLGAVVRAVPGVEQVRFDLVYRRR